MSTLVEKANINSHYGRAYVPTTALASGVTWDDDMMHVSLTDGRIISVPIAWFPRLRMANPSERQLVHIDGGGLSLHWPELDEDISVAGLMAGVDWQAA